MTILVVAPTAWHVAALAGGALARWSEDGTPAVIATPDSEGEDTRLSKVADVLGARAEPIAWPAAAWTADAEGRILITELIRTVQPALVLTTSVTGTGPRARAIGAMTFDAAFCATVPHYRTPGEVPAGGSRTAVVELDDPFTRLQPPMEYVDAATVWGTKQRAVEATATWQPGAEFPADCSASPGTVAEIVSRARGVQIQSPHGEAYTQVKVYGRMRAYRLMPSSDNSRRPARPNGEIDA